MKGAESIVPMLRCVLVILISAVMCELSSVVMSAVLPSEIRTTRQQPISPDNLLQLRLKPADLLTRRRAVLNSHEKVMLRIFKFMLTINVKMKKSLYIYIIYYSFAAMMTQW